VANEDKQHVWTNDDIKDCKLDLQKGSITSIYITSTHDWRLPLPFASFSQEAIPLHLQSRQLPEERQQKRPQYQSKPQPTVKPRYPPQPSNCRHCKEDFNSRNALFRHLELCKTSRSQASLVSSSTSLTSLTSSVALTKRSIHEVNSLYEINGLYEHTAIGRGGVG